MRITGIRRLLAWLRAPQRRVDRRIEFGKIERSHKEYYDDVARAALKR